MWAMFIYGAIVTFLARAIGRDLLARYAGKPTQDWGWLLFDLGGLVWALTEAITLAGVHT